MNSIAIPERQNLTKSIIVMAGVYSSQFDCEIKVNDRGHAGTNGTVINIPKPIPEYLDVTWGYCAHECGHIRYTNNQLVIETKISDSLLGWLLNVIEDTRIEALMVSLFPGVKKYFKSLSEKVLRFKGYDEEVQNTQLLADYIFYFIRGKLTGYPIWDESTLNIESKLIQTTNIFFVDHLSTLMDKVAYLESTESALELARELIDCIKNPPQQNDSTQSPKSGNKPDSEQDSDQSECQNESTGQTQEEDQSNSDNQNDTNIDDQSLDSGDESQLGDANQNQNDDLKKITDNFLNSHNTDRQIGDLGEAIEIVLNQSENQEAMTQEEQCDMGIGEMKAISVSKKEIDKFELQAQHTTTLLRHSLVKLMEARTRTQRITVRRGRRLSRSKVSRLANGDTRIFKRKFQERDDVLCDVAVLADTSGSMKANIDNVQVATFALLDCLDRIEGAETCAFSFSDGQIELIQKPHEGFGPNVKARIASLKATGGTPATEAYWAAVHSLLAMRSPKKVVIMVTDGSPDDASTTKQMVNLMKKNGINIVCIAVGISGNDTTTLNYVYGEHKWILVKQFCDLPRELLRVAQEII